MADFGVLVGVQRPIEGESRLPRRSDGESWAVWQLPRRPHIKISFRSLRSGVCLAIRQT